MRRLAVPSAARWATSSPLALSQREVFADKVRAGMILTVDRKYYRVTANTRAQKGQLAASFNVKLVEIGSGKKKEVTAAQGHDFQEVRSERIRLLFSGFDDDDMACFVYPEHSADAGKEINLPGDSLPEIHQKFLCCGMPVDVLHITLDEDEVKKDAASTTGKPAAASTGSNTSTDIWCEVLMPTSYVYTVEKLVLKGMYKMAAFEECDGMVSVNDSVQTKDKIKISLRLDGTAVFAGKGV